MGGKFGYHGQWLRVDCSSGRGESIPLDEDALRRFLGGSGLGAYLLLELGAATVEPLSPEAPLAFVFSPLVGSPLTTSAKFAVVCKSPLTDRINDSLASSQFALAGKRTGHDAIVLVGRAAEPSILVIDEDQARLESARDLMGKSCPETQRLVREQLGPNYAVAAIGPAGENLVRYATISHDGRHAGRGGSGAVLASKNIKAIAVRGRKTCRWAFPEELNRLSKNLSKKSLGPATAKYRELGTVSNLLLFNRMRMLPTRNFQQAEFEQAEALSPQRIGEQRAKTQKSCAACTIGCEHLFSLKDGEPAETRLEYENLFALGPLCGVGDPQMVLAASQRCDELGLDVVSAGGTIAFAMECASRGLLDAPWLRFGDGQAMLKALELIARREGVGEFLAEGSRIAAGKIDGDSIAFAPQVKGLEIPGYEPRSMQAMALGFAVGTRGADHNRSGAYEVDFSEEVDRRDAGPEAAASAVETEDRAAVMDSMILCKFLRGALDDYWAETAEMLRLVVGWDMTVEELRRTARRIVSAKKLFNIRAGWTPDEDTLPDRFLDSPLPGDGAVLTRDRLGEMIRAYNLHRGWSAEGRLDEEALR
ncbi:MAG: aldehyde ferredoxin oxidoreductase family protein [Planctomycetales bacterium]